MYLQHVVPCISNLEDQRIEF